MVTPAKSGRNFTLYLDTAIWVVQRQSLLARSADDLPPHKLLIPSPDDTSAGNRTKRDTNWTGCTVHLTETGDRDLHHLITKVETTPATTGDVEMTQVIHQALQGKHLLPQEHIAFLLKVRCPFFQEKLYTVRVTASLGIPHISEKGYIVDTAYVDTQHLLTSETELGIELLGPVPPDSSWQQTAKLGFELSGFIVDWEHRHATCPQGHISKSWHQCSDHYGNPVIQVR